MYFKLPESYICLNCLVVLFMIYARDRTVLFVMYSRGASVFKCLFSQISANYI
jgi:hypothetical protein